MDGPLLLHVASDRLRNGLSLRSLDRVEGLGVVTKVLKRWKKGGGGKWQRRNGKRGKEKEREKERESEREKEERGGSGARITK